MGAVGRPYAPAACLATGCLNALAGRALAGRWQASCSVNVEFRHRMQDGDVQGFRVQLALGHWEYAEQDRWGH